LCQSLSRNGKQFSIAADNGEGGGSALSNPDFGIGVKRSYNGKGGANKSNYRCPIILLDAGWKWWYGRAVLDL
jgi:hypothetical protein